MSRLASATATMGAALLALAALDGCTAGGPDVPAPPPVANTAPAPRSPELMGGPPEQAGVREQRVTEPAFTTMAPIANPEDMTPEERAQVYGHRYDRPRRRVHARGDHAAGEFAGGAHRQQRGLADHHVDGYRLAARHGYHQAAPARTARVAGADRTGASTAPVPGVANPGPAAEVESPVPPAPLANAVQAAPATQPINARVAPAAGPNLDWLSIPGAPVVTLPGLGAVPSRFITAAFLLVLALILLAVAAGIGQSAPRRRAPRRAVGAGPAFAGDFHSAEPSGRIEPVDAPVAAFPQHAE